MVTMQRHKNRTCRRPILNRAGNWSRVRLVAACLLLPVYLPLLPIASREAKADLSTTPYHYIKMISGLCLDVPGSSTGLVQIIQYQCTGNPNQKFRFVPTGNTTPSPEYYIQNQNSGQCLDVEASGTAPGTRILQFPCTNGANQRFMMKPFKYGIRFINTNGMCFQTSSYAGSGAALSINYCGDTTPTNSWSTLGPYCRICAANYADRWASGFNTTWYGMVSGYQTADCTNYASQVMGSGGYKMWTGGAHSSWNFYGNAGYSASWNGAAPNYYSLVNFGAVVTTYPPGFRPSYTGLSQGDMLFYDYSNTGYPDHQSVLTGWGNTQISLSPPTFASRDYVNAHTSSRYHAVWHLDIYNPFFQTTSVLAVQLNPYAGIF